MTGRFREAVSRSGFAALHLSDKQQSRVGIPLLVMRSCGMLAAALQSAGRGIWPIPASRPLSFPV